jgi:hypothetical protein
MLEAYRFRKVRGGGTELKKLFLAVLALLAFAVAIPAVFAQDQPPDLPSDWIHGISVAAKATPIAVILALLNCIVGYLSKTPAENFKLENFVYTALISFTIGVGTLYAGWSYSTIQLWFANGFLTWYLWKVSEIIARKLHFTRQVTLASGPSPPKT